MSLSPKQRKRVAWLIDGHLADDYDEATHESRWEKEFAALDSPEQLHLFASESHPNLGPDEWRRVLDSPLCDMGTALLVFWRNNPVYHYKNAELDKVTNHDRPTLDMLQEIERKYLAVDYPHAVVRFDPRSYRGHNFLDTQLAEAVERVPMVLRQPSQGEEIPPLAAEDFEWGAGFQ